MSSLDQCLSAEFLTQALGGKWSGKQGIARCPAHDDRKPSLSISQNPRGGNPLVYCHAGCSQDAVIAELKQRDLWATINGSVFARTDAPPRANKSLRAAQPTPQDNQKKATAAHEAQSIWNRCKPAPQDHPYLRKKQIEAYGARVDNDHLVIPIQDTEGNFHGLQYISPAGDKRFLSGSSITGHFWSLGDKDPSKPLYIAEGFATAATVHQATGSQVVVAFNAGNLIPVAKALRDKWQNREIVLCADDDAKTDSNPGRTQAQEAALAIDAKIAIPDFGAQCPEGVTDFNDQAKLLGLEAVRESIHAAKDPLWPEPQPLTGKIDPAPYPLDALPATLRAAVEEVQAFTQAPLPLVASSALGVLSVAAQAHANVVRAERLEGSIGLFILIIADSGERKSTCDSFFMKPIRGYEAKQADLNQQAINDYKAEEKAWEAKSSGIKEKIRTLSKEGGRKDTEISKWEEKLREMENVKPSPPRVPRLIYNDTTPEALKWSMAKQWPVAGIVSSEAGTVFGSHGMGKGSIMRNLAIMNKLWDGTELITDRRASESFTVLNGRLSTVLQVQEDTLRTFLDETKGLARDSGFISRILFTWPESTQGFRFYKEPMPNWPALERFNRRLTEILEQPVRVDERKRLSPPTLNLNHDAKKAWVTFYNEIEKQLRPGGEACGVKDVGAKTPDNAVRIAALFHILEHGTDGNIEVPHLKSAGIIAAWHLNESRRFLGELALPQEESNAIQLDNWLVKWCKQENTNVVLRRKVQQNVTPIRLRQKEALNISLKELKETNRLRLIEIGKRKEIHVNPALLESDKQ